MTVYHAGWATSAVSARRGASRPRSAGPGLDGARRHAAKGLSAVKQRGRLRRPLRQVTMRHVAVGDSQTRRAILSLASLRPEYVRGGSHMLCEHEVGLEPS